MKRILAAFAACLLLGMPDSAAAEEPQTSITSVVGWEAVGRLNISGRNMCTGALVAPDLVVTAAHCVYDPVTGRQVDPTSIRFDAGLNGRRAKAARSITKTVVHPSYQYGQPGDSQLGNDIAILRLDRPISRKMIQPFELANRPARGASVEVLSYSMAQQNRPNLEQNCHVLARQAQILVMTCRVDFGASGAPVFDVAPGRMPRLVSVISAKAAVGNRRVSIGTSFDRTVIAMMRSAS
ncbi:MULTISPECIES: serine protease [Phaeobacter]|uniref:V8-like Glu-specific endopeptidase n=1 Tax=Phaeobacter piscinae TaxID=1580596 RepID=A0ABM6P9I9_9RHOB|nr:MULTISPECIES: trypsin-like serine protease [Phaeobacter]ATG34336.1 V8-like Glu-specific endopeptidase [Phaeobacter piscinae]ATG38294.1 V8-like Glu-specific endopeptidase [Phaeobacter piscinae]AUQ84856.1 V8-like Glu-specific endopeptidase [Phaeobacter piscinae]AUR22739.1 V8-like Glu-specific endopeptidase [Phaeobacter piscinae]KII14567.1 trypsin [Phaeobacter sp. S60]